MNTLERFIRVADWFTNIGIVLDSFYAITVYEDEIAYQGYQSEDVISKLTTSNVLFVPKDNGMLISYVKIRIDDTIINIRIVLT